MNKPVELENRIARKRELFEAKMEREPDEDEEYQMYRQAVEQVLKEQVGGSPKLIFSVSDEETGMPITDFDTPVYKGQFQVKQKYEPFWGKGQDYLSDIVTDPTWLDLARLAEKQIRTTGDFRHIYLEQAYISDEPHENPNVRFIALFMGS